MTLLCTSPELNSLEIVPDEIHIWCASLKLWEPYVNILEKKLSAHEQERANKFIFEMGKNRFIAGRYVLRMLIGSYLSMPTESVRFLYGAQGKPAIDPLINGKKLCFNLSHSREMAVYIFALNRSVGIDLEYTQKLYKGQSIIERWFTEREQTIYSGLPEGEKKSYFYRAWTMKEAYLKGFGGGLAIPLDQIELVDNNQIECSEKYQFKDQLEGSNWHLSTFIPCKDFLGTYAIRNENVPYHVKQWELTDTNSLII